VSPSKSQRGEQDWTKNSPESLTLSRNTVSESRLEEATTFESRGRRQGRKEPMGARFQKIYGKRGWKKATPVSLAPNEAKSTHGDSSVDRRKSRRKEEP